MINQMLDESILSLPGDVISEVNMAGKGWMEITPYVRGVRKRVWVDPEIGNQS
jgi:hypothetical protein